MKRFIAVTALLLVFILSGCNNPSTKNTDGNKSLSGDTPPSVTVEIDRETYETILGSYCWEISSTKETATTECADTVGPVELLEDKEPIQVQAGNQITLKMDYTPKPNEIQLSQIKNNDETEIEINNNQFTAPNEKGVYYYAYSVSWMDEKETRLSHGSAFYAFVIEVQ